MSMMKALWVMVQLFRSLWTYIRYVFEPQKSIILTIVQGMSFFVNRLRFLYPFQRFVESAIDNGRLRYEVAIQ